MLLTSKNWNCALTLGEVSADDIVHELLKSRGIETDEKIADFVSDEPSEWYDPYLFVDMRKAVDIIVESMSNNEKILVYGDYDADGVTATSILVRYFRSHKCDVDYIVPQRAAHGYGLTDYILEDVLEKFPGLLITVDCGISNFDTIAKIREKGIKVIVTDHHTVQEKIPDADAVICAKRQDNTYPCIDLCGAGVAMKLVEALGRDGRFRVFNSVWRQVVELAGIATIADLVPIVGENRTLVKRAFQSMREPTNIGIRVMNELLLDSGKDPDESYISFVFVPRINAAGRLYDSSDALNLFLNDDKSKVRDAAMALTKQNDERKAIEAQVFEEAKAQIENSDRPEEWLLTNTKGPIVAYGKNWHQGVLGIVAGKLSQHFRRSAIVFTDDGLDTENVKGSSRAYGEFDIYHAIENASEFCVNFGGHKKAAGLVVKKKDLGKFMRALEAYSRSIEDDDSGKDELTIDAQIDSTSITMDVHDALRQMSPFGLGNSKPVFVTRNLLVSNMQFMSEGAHIRFDLHDPEKDPDLKNTISAVGFGMGNYASIIKVGDKVDIAYTMNIFNLWGNDTLSLHLCDIKPVMPDNILWSKSEVPEKLYASGLELSQIVKLSKGNSVEELIPTSENYTDTYKTIRDTFGNGISIVDIDLLARAVEIKSGNKITPFQVTRCLEVLDEAGVIRLGRSSPRRVCLNLAKTDKRPNLHDTPTYKRLSENV
ncbi:MAG: single-stranded-DNA-specific exonuclease RecJ [Clostridiales bacterium]|nr:single-stranded-DNA-specific exonuclease RecJ [Clostridiales bacterium]